MDRGGKKKDFMEALASAGADRKHVARSKHAFHEVLGELLERAQREGVVRETSPSARSSR